MSDPWSPKGRIRRSNETRDPLDEFRQRLGALGATDEEVEEWTGSATYADLDADQRAEFERIRHASDEEIRFEIEAVRGGEDDEEDLDLAGEGTVAVGVDEPGISPEVDAIAHQRIENEATGEPQEAAVGTITREDVPPAEAVEVDDTADSTGEPWETEEPEAVTLPPDLLDKNVPEILDWVAGDPTKAAIVLEMESLDDKPRKTLVEPLRETVDGAPG